MSASARTPGLPPPSADALAQSARLVERIRADIAEHGGSIGFERYMELALYAPGLGYYSGGAAKLGEEGDFVTAPEISPLFGRCIARQCAQVLEVLGGGDLLEFGAGSGALAAQMLPALERLGVLPGRYLILERSAELRERQRRRIAALGDTLAERVVWLDALPGERLEGVIVANEVLDAFPVARFRVRRAGGAIEYRALEVGWTADGPGTVERTADAPLQAACERLEKVLPTALPDGYQSEYCPGLAAWTATLGELLSAGAALLVDYGLPTREYYLPERNRGTLSCHYRHRMHDDPFVYPGLQDITAWVDFTVVAEAADAAGLTVSGFSTQAHFLMAAGLEDELALAGTQSPGDAAVLAAQVRRLVLPGEMGERFRVMGLTRGIDVLLAGFSGRDLRGRL